MQLRTDDGTLVKEPEIPDRKNPPDVIVAGKRVFVRGQGYKMTGSMIFIEAPAEFIKEAL